MYFPSEDCLIPKCISYQIPHGFTILPYCWSEDTIAIWLWIGFCRKQCCGKLWRWLSNSFVSRSLRFSIGDECLLWEACDWKTQLCCAMDRSNAKERHWEFLNRFRLTVASVLEMGDPEPLKHTPTLENDNLNRINVVKGVSIRRGTM